MPTAQNGRGTEANLFRCRPFDGADEVRIEVSTVHAVKGETHAATLFLETFYYQYDLGCVLDRIKAECAIPERGRMREMLPVTYVALSRPTDFLCLAMHEHGEKVSRGPSAQDIAELRAVGWDVLRVPEVLRAEAPARERTPVAAIPMTAALSGVA
jgi:hypothetical protein